MTRQEAFNKKRPQLEKSLGVALLKSAKKYPEGFLEWLGMSVTPEAVKALKEE